jgi:hypothetical protein
MSKFEGIIFVTSIIVCKQINLINKDIDLLTKILFFQNIYLIILFFFVIVSNFYFKYKKYLKFNKYVNNF